MHSNIGRRVLHLQGTKIKYKIAFSKCEMTVTREYASLASLKVLGYLH